MAMGRREGDQANMWVPTHSLARSPGHVFYDKLNYVTGIEVGFGGVWVMSPPYFYFIPDRDGDDRFQASQRGGKLETPEGKGGGRRLIESLGRGGRRAGVGR